MSKEEVTRFLLFTEQFKELNGRYQGIVGKYEGKGLTDREYEKVISEEVIPLAESVGCHFSLAEFLETILSAGGQLTDDELDKAVGGRGEYTDVRHVPFTISIKYSCEMAPDDETFATRFHGYDGCPDYSRRSIGPISPNIPLPGACCCMCRYLVTH